MLSRKQPGAGEKYRQLSDNDTCGLTVYRSNATLASCPPTRAIQDGLAGV